MISILSKQQQYKHRMLSWHQSSTPFNSHSIPNPQYYFLQDSALKNNTDHASSHNDLTVCQISMSYTVTLSYFNILWGSSFSQLDVPSLRKRGSSYFSFMFETLARIWRILPMSYIHLFRNPVRGLLMSGVNIGQVQENWIKWNNESLMKSTSQKYESSICNINKFIFIIFMLAFLGP